MGVVIPFAPRTAQAGSLATAGGESAAAAEAAGNGYPPRLS